MSLADRPRPEPAAFPRWLSIVGIGEEGVEALTPAARSLIQDAAVVFGGARHLALAAPLIRGACRPWPTPFDRTVSEVLSHRGQRVCILASGDPFHHGVGALLARHVPRDEMESHPAASAFSLAASRLAWPLQDTTLLSLCGRSLDFVRPHLQPTARVVALVSDGEAPAQLARLLCETGFGTSQITVLEALGGKHERIRASRAQDFALDSINPLNTVAIEVTAERGARVIARASGLADELFEHDGQISKREVRALTLSALAPRRGELLWDVGAGSGSIAIEWLLADLSLRAIAVEQRPDRAACIRRNASAFGVPHLSLIEGSAPDALEGLATPDAVFIGGGTTTPGIIEAAQNALRPGGRLVINAVSLQTEAALLRCQSQWRGVLTRIAISRASPIGGAEARMTGWRTAMPVTQWIWVKP
jgi:precorrin-6B C5,15-methyltransferase / cobalt-precorrin-6B C5,C15-methyltransferase